MRLHAGADLSIRAAEVLLRVGGRDEREGDDLGEHRRSVGAVVCLRGGGEPGGALTVFGGVRIVFGHLEPRTSVCSCAKELFAESSTAQAQGVHLE